MPNQNNQPLTAWEEYKTWWGSYKGESPTIKIEDYFQHPLFSQTMSLNRSTMAIVDKKQMRYLYISDNVFDIMGWTKETYQARGVEFAFNNILEDDKIGMNLFSKTINEYFPSLSPDEKSRYQCFWDYRVRTSDNRIIRILQRDHVLQYDENGNISIVMVLCIEITDYKKENNLHLRLTTGQENLLYEYSLGERKIYNLEELTHRELEITRLINKGYTRQEIADKLNISINTVRTHCKNILEKMRVDDSVTLSNLMKIVGLL